MPSCTGLASTKHQQTLHTMEMRMLPWSLRLTRLDQVRNKDIRMVLGVAPIIEKMRAAHLRWDGHVVRSSEESVDRRVLRLSPDGQQPRGWPKKRWMDRIKENMKQVNTTPDDAWTRSCGEWRDNQQTLHHGKERMFYIIYYFFYYLAFK